MFSSERNELRNVFFNAWKKHLEKLPIEPLEAEVIDIILQHPEYHSIVNNPNQYQAKDFDETNPFLHMSLHLALREQIKTNRPAGIHSIYNTLCEKLSGQLRAEHVMMECLEKVLWEAQKNGVMPDEQYYLNCLKQLSL